MTCLVDIKIYFSHVTPQTLVKGDTAKDVGNVSVASSVDLQQPGSAVATPILETIGHLCHKVKQMHTTPGKGWSFNVIYLCV